MLHRKNDGKYLRSEWHTFRENARQTSISLNDFSPEEVTEYELEDAGLTGEDLNINYTYNRPIDLFASNGTDVRQMEDR